LFDRLAGVYVDGGRLDDAAAVLQHGLAARPGHLAGRVTRARLALARERPGEARADLDEVLALSDHHWGALQLLAHVHHLTGDRDGELAAVERMLSLLPQDESLVTRRTQLENDDGERPRMPHRPLHDERASAQTQPARAAGPQPGLPAETLRPAPSADPFLNATMAELLASQGDVEGALTMLQQLVERSPDRQDLRARFVELGGDGAALPAPPAPSMEPAALEDALQGILDAGPS
jgi:predicted Zn-dependent protease